MLFHKIEGAAAVLSSKGVFRQVDVYQRDNQLYARWGSGFIGLRYTSFSTAEIGTTLPHVQVQHIEGPFTFSKKGFGAVKVTSGVTARAA